MSVKTAPRIPDNILYTTPDCDGGSGSFGALSNSYGQQSNVNADISTASSNATHLGNKLPLETKAPPVQNPYSMENSMSDLPCAAYALDLFLASHMFESEDYLDKGDPRKWGMAFYL